MADPLSIAASIITVIGAADSVGKVLSKIKIARNAPAEVLALQNEISDLQLVLEDVNLCNWGERRVQPSTISERFKRLEILITRTESRLCELNRILNHRLIRTHSVTGVPLVSRAIWLRVRGAVEDIRCSLRVARQDITLQLASINL